MAGAQRRADIVKRKIDIFREEQEGWIDDHDKAMVCFELEEIFKDGARIYDDICRLDECWHIQFYREPNGYCRESAEFVKNLFKAWFDSATRGLDLFDRIRIEYVTRGFDINRYTQLEACQTQCAAILNPSDEETELADIAINLNRNGETAEMEV